LLKGIRWGAGWYPRRRPRTHGGLIQTTALVDRPSDQSIVMSAGKQRGQANKQENEQCGSNPPKGLPQAESHKSVDSASQWGYQWQFANCEERYATYLQREIRAVPARSRKAGTRLGDRGPAQTRAGVTAPAARAVRGRRSGPLGGGGWSVATATASTTRMRGRVVGSSRCGAEARCGACLRRRVAVSVRAGAGGRAGLRPVVAAAGWPVCAAPSSSALLGAVVVGVSLPRRQGESHDAEGG